MKQTRFLYFLSAIFIAVLGILSRKVNGIPLFIGDILYDVMIYFGCRLIFINGSNYRKIIIPLLLCYAIELQQLYNAEWIIGIRNTTLGHYVLGQGFLWSDLLCYTAGVVMAFWIDILLLKYSNLKSNIDCPSPDGTGKQNCVLPLLWLGGESDQRKLLSAFTNVGKTRFFLEGTAGLATEKDY